MLNLLEFKLENIPVIVMVGVYKCCCQFSFELSKLPETLGLWKKSPYIDG